MQFDERSDLYSLGVILYEVVAGRLPFDATTVQAMLRQHAYDIPRPLPERVPAPVVDLLFRLLEKEPERRPQSAVEVHDTLVSLTGLSERLTPLPLGGRRAASQPSGFPTPNTPISALGRAAPSVGGLDQTMSLGRRRKPWVALGAIGVILSAAAVLIASGAFDRTDRSSDQPSIEPAPIKEPPAAPVAAAGTPSTPTSGSLPAAPEQVSLDLASDPPGAEVVIAGNVVGKTPLQHPIARSDQPVTIEFRKSGFMPRSKDVVPDQDGEKVAVSLDRKPVARPPGGKTSGKTGKTGKTSGSGKTVPADRPTPKPPVTFVP
jgi:serine/threonine-protein kinase